MVVITFRGITDFDSLSESWRALEQQSDPVGRFFRGWTWTGCLASERFTDSVLLEARENGQIVALALFNRHREALAPATLLLGESGDPAQDTIFIEHNAILTAIGQLALQRSCLAACLTAALPRRASRPARALVLSGVGDTVLDLARSLPFACHLRRTRPAPYVDLTVLQPDDFPAVLSSSSRYQLRRSRRRYAEAGRITVRRAADVAEGLTFFDALGVLHQTTWTARGRPGAFASPFFVRFHRELITRGLPRGEIDLLHVAAGTRTIGYLYNFVSNGWVGNYQGGFDYAGADSHQKPGLTCHHLAIEFYCSERRVTYDFLAGEDRYKASLAQSEVQLHWLELLPAWSARNLALSGKAWLKNFLRGIGGPVTRLYRRGTPD